MLCHESEWRDPVGVEFVLIAKDDWFKRENRFGQFVRAKCYEDGTAPLQYDARAEGVGN